MLPAYDIFKDEIIQLNNYIESIDCYNKILSIDFNNSNTDIDKIIKLKEISNKFNKRKYEYSTIIISLYGCFEQFVENFVKDYLMLLVEDCKEYSKLPSIIKDKHINLSVLLIGKIDQSKYINSLSKEKIIRNLNDCIQDNKCLINYEAFCQHTANFRVQTIAEVLKNIGLSNIINSVKRNKPLKELYIQNNGECNYDGLEPDTVFSFLNELADRRNQVAHGFVSNILSMDLQKEMVKKVSFFVEEMDRIGFEKALPYLTSKSYKIDVIYNPILKSHTRTKLLCFCFDGVKIAVGDIVIIKDSEDNYTYCRIDSMQIDHKGIGELITYEKVDIGIMLTCNRKAGEEYWIYNTVDIYIPKLKY